MRICIAGVLLAMVASLPVADAKKSDKSPPKGQLSAPPRAVSELMGPYQWGISPEEAQKIVSDGLNTRYQALMVKEQDPLRQDAIRRELTDELAKLKDNYIKFDGQKTGWDVSLIDREFSHNNNESMFVVWEKDQRRFLFFYNNKLWKQFVAFNAEHPAFAGKTFDDFAEIVQKRYGRASATFRKQRSNDDQTFDHLEWPPMGDTILWAIDMTSLYNNFCLSLSQKSVMAEVEKERKSHVAASTGQAARELIDSVVTPDKPEKPEKK